MDVYTAMPEERNWSTRDAWQGLEVIKYGDNAAMWESLVTRSGGETGDTILWVAGLGDCAPKEEWKAGSPHGGGTGFPMKGRPLISLSCSPLGEFSAEVSFLIHIWEFNFFFFLREKEGEEVGEEH